MTGFDKDIKKWIDLSDYDIKTAEAMFKSGRYLYVLFCCQQSLEKRLKGLVVKTKKIFPPRTHDLLKLATLCEIKLSDTDELFLRRLSNYYIGTRYPEEVNELANSIDRNIAGIYIKDTKGVIKWLDCFLK